MSSAASETAVGRKLKVAAHKKLVGMLEEEMFVLLEDLDFYPISENTGSFSGYKVFTLDEFKIVLSIKAPPQALKKVRK